MTRIVKYEEHKPTITTIGNESKAICMCGLSKIKPLCDGSHRETIGEENGKLYEYKNGKRFEVKIEKIA